MTTVLDYNATFDPSSVSGTIQVSASGTDVLLSFTEVASFSVSLSATGNVAQWIVSSIAKPLAQTIVNWVTGIVPTLATSIKPFKVASVPSYPITYEGATVTATPSDVSISNYNGMMLLTATVTLS